MTLGVLLEKIVRDREKDRVRPYIFTLQIQAVFRRAASIKKQTRLRECVFCAVGVICIRVCVYICMQQYPRRISVRVYVFRVALRVEYTLAANSADRSLINRSHYQATSECA